MPSTLAIHAFSTILNHSSFLSNFLEVNLSRLPHAYSICTRLLRKHAIPYIPSNAGFFIWADFTAYLETAPGDTDLEKERAMNDKLLDGGIHLATSEAFFGEDYG